MEFLEGFANWKMLLMKGYCDPEQAQSAGRILGTIHRKNLGTKKRYGRNSRAPKIFMPAADRARIS